MKCENCGKEHDGSYGSGRFCCKHCRYVYIGKQTKIHICNFNKGKNPQRRGRSPYGTWKCSHCGEIFETRKLLNEHLKVNHSNHKCRFCGKVFPTGGKLGSHIIHCKLNPKYDEYHNIRVNVCGKLNKGKHHSSEFRKKVSESMKRYYIEHPDLVPYKLHHSSKKSYPEQYFENLFESENILGFKRELNICGYFLDFAFEDKKIDFEVDGSQHYVDPKIVEHDKIRTEKLESLGWTVVRCRWEHWQKYSKEEKKVWINNFKNII